MQLANVADLFADRRRTCRNVQLGNSVASPDITVDYKHVSDPLASTPNYSSDDSVSAVTVGIATSEVAAIPQSFGRYRVDGVLGRGGFGAVYRAWDDQLERAVAIKVTYRNKFDPVLREMFLAEARIVAKLDHSVIVPVHDAVALEGKRLAATTAGTVAD